MPKILSVALVLGNSRHAGRRTDSTTPASGRCQGAGDRLCEGGGHE